MKKIILSNLVCLFLITSCSNNNITENSLENINIEAKISSSNNLNPSLTSFILKLFTDLDMNKDTKLSKNEVKNSIWYNKFQFLDKNNDNKLSLDESILFVSDEEIQRVTQEKFKIVDINNNLLIEFSELDKFYKKSHDESDENKVKAIFSIFQSFDKNRDASLNIDEFRKFIYILPISGFNSFNPIIKKFPDIL